MKKYIYLIFAALSALLLLSACRREQPVEVKKPALKVVSSNVVFGVEGGEGTIVVEADGTVSVTSERPWVQTSVNGNTITVTVSELNPSPQSRYSRLTIQAGSEKTYVTVHQFGEIFDGMKMEDVTVASAGTTMRYGFKANMSVDVTADQPWVHCEMDEENEGVLVVTVDKHEGFGTRFANVSFTAGTHSGSMKITQEPTYGAVSGWTVEDTDGRFVFPDQIDVIEVTPPADMATAPPANSRARTSLHSSGNWRPLRRKPSMPARSRSARALIPMNSRTCLPPPRPSSLSLTTRTIRRASML